MAEGQAKWASIGERSNDEGEADEPLLEIINQIIEVVDSDDPKDEWKNLKSLMIFKQAKNRVESNHSPFKEIEQSSFFKEAKQLIKDSEAVAK